MLTFDITKVLFLEGMCSYLILRFYSICEFRTTLDIKPIITLWRKSCIKLIILEMKFRIICGESHVYSDIVNYGNTSIKVRCKNI